MTQERLGAHLGLSRTSITNIEKGRQNVSLHHLFAIAGALKVAPENLLPSLGEASGTSWVEEKMPPGTEPELAQWASKLVGGQTGTETR